MTFTYGRGEPKKAMVSAAVPVMDAGRLRHHNAFKAEAITVEVGSLKEKIQRVLDKKAQLRDDIRDFIEIFGVIVGGVIALQGLRILDPKNNQTWFIVGAVLTAVYILLLIGLLVWVVAKHILRKRMNHISIDELIQEIRDEGDADQL